MIRKPPALSECEGTCCIRFWGWGGGGPGNLHSNALARKGLCILMLRNHYSEKQAVHKTLKLFSSFSFSS